MAETKENIVMFPFMAQGHIIPFLALALELENKTGYTITFVNIPQNIKKIQPLIPPTSAIRLLEIPFDPSAHGLPTNFETTESLPPLLMLRLFITSPSLQPAFRKLISDLVHQHRQPPLCIISDMFFGWSAKVAHEFGAFHAIFNVGGGSAMALFHSIWLNLPHKNTKTEEFPIPGFPEGHSIHIKQLPDHFHYAVAGDPWCSFLKQMFQDWLETDGMLFNTIEEMDHVGLEYFRKQIGCPVWPIGPILSSLGSKARADQHFIAKMLEEETGVCIGLARGSCEAKYKDIVEKIEVMMGGTCKGQDVKTKACEIRDLLGIAKKDEKNFKGASAIAMDDFLTAVLSKSTERQIN
ncbi:UDP-Glycosyltransferase superfamily protein [Actinidia rufa]|uniref:UDP-Glycosyltransferase superfamily protein n=1 Tax=Actinidia rufa TaxID=165716 RepID=A0A7J0HC07_9ERIC|nr:UDP-Glycosyltransferase superfamily protein [Actinidia rufa]